MNKRYKVISLHFTTDCNLNCPFCYRPKNKKGKPFKFFMDLIPYIAELSPQVALGGGEPFLYPEFVKSFSKECKKFNLLCNVTTNGTLPMKNYVKDIEMVSVSYDEAKYNGLSEYLRRVETLKGKTRIGCNLLIRDYYVESPHIFMMLLNSLFRSVERVFALYPKNYTFIDILKMKPIYYAPTFNYKHFYVDDLTNMILTENKYKNWKHPCHYGKDIISIAEDGSVTGCSFDCKDKALLKLKKPEDLLKIKDVKIKERYSCPYLKRI